MEKFATLDKLRKASIEQLCEAEGLVLNWLNGCTNFWKIAAAHEKKVFSIRFSLFLQSLFSDGDDWPKWRGLKGNGTWAGPPIMKELPASGLKKNWQLKVFQATRELQWRMGWHI